MGCTVAYSYACKKKIKKLVLFEVKKHILTKDAGFKAISQRLDERIHKLFVIVQNFGIKSVNYRVQLMENCLTASI